MNIDEYNASLEQDKQNQQDTNDNDQQDQDGLLDFGDDNEDLDGYDSEDNDNTDENQDDNQDNQDDNQSTDDNQTEDKQEKKVQTPEENAKFAEMRRQQQLDKQLQDRVQQSPEYQIAKMLADKYGVTTDQMLNQLKEAQIQEEAQKQGVPVEVLKRMQAQEERLKAQEQQFQQLQFQQWQNRIAAETETVKKDFPMLSEDDIRQSIDHMLGVMRNPEIPLEDAIFAVHGKKILQAQREQAKNDALAEVSGRAGKSPLGPQGGKPNPTTALTPDEKYVARQMGISEKDYLKYKSMS